MVGYALQSRDEVAGLVVVDRVFVVELPEIPSLAGGLCSPWRAAHSLPPRRRGPCRNEPVCWEHTFFLCLPARLQASLLRSGTNTKKNRKIFIFRFISAEREGFDTQLQPPPDTPPTHYCRALFHR